MLSNYIGTLDGDECFLYVRQNVLNRIRGTSLQASNREVGGVLTGCYRGDHIDVTGLTSPKPHDVATKYSFHRKSNIHEKLVQKKWSRSGHFLTYVGEWHSHFEEKPTPSAIDVTSWINASRLYRRTLVFVIVGYSDFWLGCAVYTPNEVRIIQSKKVGT